MTPPRDDVERTCALCGRTGYRQFDQVPASEMFRCRNYESCRTRQRDKARSAGRPAASMSATHPANDTTLQVDGAPADIAEATPAPPSLAPYDPWPDMVAASQKLDAVLRRSFNEAMAKPIDAAVLRGTGDALAVQPAQPQPVAPPALPAHAPPGVVSTARCVDCSRTFISTGAKLAAQIEQHERNRPGHLVVPVRAEGHNGP